MYAGADALFIVRTERLRTDLAAVLQRMRGVPDARIEHFLHNAPSMNVSLHGHHRRYYDTRLCGLVADKDRSIIERYEHEF